jgi:anti-sigma regulatory factor (Ser/Thr protein kinase)
VRAFGEMVALLWAAGDVAGAIELEALWNDLAEVREFSLLCAYSMSALAGHDDLGSVGRVCELHSSVHPPRSYVDDADAATDADRDEHTELFLPLPVAVAAVRRLVTSALGTWGLGAVVPDATSAVSEMATNAIRHASSAFRVTIRRSDGVVRISVEDVGPARPKLVRAGPEQTGGRGVALVAELSQRWGFDPVPAGKIVWCEFSAR